MCTLSLWCSVFNEEPIPYPKRECIDDEDNKEDKNDAANGQVCVSWVSVICMQLLVLILTEEWTKGAFREEGQTQLR